MNRLKFFLTPMVFFLLLWGTSIIMSPSVQAQVEAIDDQIRTLEEMKRGYEAKALRHEDQAIRLQFEERWNLEVRRHLELAEENRRKAAFIQKEIDRLEDKRRELLGEPNGFEDL